MDGMHMSGKERPDSKTREGMLPMSGVASPSMAECHLTLGTWLHPECIMGRSRIRLGRAVSTRDIWVWGQLWEGA